MTRSSSSTWTRGSRRPPARPVEILLLRRSRRRSRDQASGLWPLASGRDTRARCPKGGRALRFVGLLSFQRRMGLPRLRPTVVIALVVGTTVLACAQIQGLDGYEKVDC